MTANSTTAKQRRRREPLSLFFEQQRHRLRQQVFSASRRADKAHKDEAPMGDRFSSCDDLVFEYRR